MYRHDIVMSQGKVTLVTFGEGGVQKVVSLQHPCACFFRPGPSWEGFSGNPKLAEKSVPQEIIFFRGFLDFPVFAHRFSVYLGWPGPFPGLILGVFWDKYFLDRFFEHFLQKMEKMEKVNCAQNHSPASRFEGFAD